MKKILVIVFALFCTLGLLADDYDTENYNEPADNGYGTAANTDSGSNYSESDSEAPSDNGYGTAANTDGGSDYSESASEAPSFYIQPTFGIGAAFYGFSMSESSGGYTLHYDETVLANQFGITVGADVAWSVWRNDGDAAGNLYVGADVAFEYWVPTKHKYDLDPWHVMRLPIQAYVAYEFELNAGPLTAVGPYYSMGVGLNFVTTKNDEGLDHFKASFRWGLGASVAFTGNWVVKIGFGGDAGPGQTDSGYTEYGDHINASINWNANSFFMVEGAVRF